MTGSSRASWDALAPSNHRLPEEHPWPQRKDPTLRDYHVVLGCEAFGFTVGRLGPGESVQHHHHREAEEVYLLVQGRSQVRIGDEVVEAKPFDAFRFDPATPRSVYNHTDEEAVWLFMGGPLDEYRRPDFANILDT